MLSEKWNILIKPFISEKEYADDSGQIYNKTETKRYWYTNTDCITYQNFTKKIYRVEHIQIVC